MRRECYVSAMAIRTDEASSGAKALGKNVLPAFYAPYF